MGLLKKLGHLLVLERCCDGGDQNVQIFKNKKSGPGVKGT